MSPSNQETRQVCVLTPFTDREGTERAKGDVFAAAYANARQRQAVNEMIHRGFLTFDVDQAAKLQEQPKGQARTRRGGTQG